MARFWDKALKSSLAMLVVFSTLFFMSPNIKVEAKETIMKFIQHHMKLLIKIRIMLFVHKLMWYMKMELMLLLKRE